MKRVRAHRIGLAVSGAGAFCALSVFVFWFRTGSFFARGDLGPFVHTGLRPEFGEMWTHQNTGAGGPSYEVVRGIELLFADVARVVGGGDALGQRLLFAAIFAFAATGVSALVARFVTQVSVVFIAGVVGAFAPLTMVNLPNFLLPVCIGLLAWASALVVDAARQGPRRVRTLALLTLSASYLALNPPLLVITVLWIATLPVTAAAVTLTGRPGVARGYRYLGWTALWAVPLSLWWSVPYLLAMRSASGAGTIHATTSVASWSWSHGNGSLDRVLMLIAKWSWPDPRFAANASWLATNGWIWLAAALPVGLLCAPLVARRALRRPALWCILGVLVLGFVAKGLNEPLERVNTLFYRLPGTWLLREPASKVGVVMVPLVLVGWALAVDGLFARPRTRRSYAALAFLLAAPLLFALPMFTGSVLQPNDRVKVPQAWVRVARVVNEGRLGGKAMILPLDDFYQMPTTWGYYGIDTLANQLLTRPAIAPIPQSYIGDPREFTNLAGAAEAGILSGDPNAVQGALRALGVSYVVVRRDIDHASRIRVPEVAGADALTAGLASVPTVRRILQTAVADVYEVAGEPGPVQVLTGTITARGSNDAALASLVASAPAGTAVTASAPRIPLSQGEATLVDVNATRTATVSGPGVLQYERRAARAPLLELRTAPTGLVLHEPATIRLGTDLIATRPDEAISGTGPAVAADIDGTLLDLSQGAAYARVAPGTAVTALSLDPVNRLNNWSELGDCNRYSDVDARAAGLALVGSASPAGAGIGLRAVRHSACVSAPVEGAVTNQVVRLSLDARAVRGAPPRVCLWQSKLRQCAPLTWLTTRAEGWSRRRAMYRIPVDGGLRLFVYADEPPPGAPYTESRYRSIKVERLVPGPVRNPRLLPVPPKTLTVTSSSIPVNVTYEDPSPAIGARSAAQDCARVDDRNLKSVGISAVAVPGEPTAVRLAAREHSACVSLPVTGMRPAVTYELDVDARVVRGAAARVCVWQDTTNRCARFVPVGESADSRGRLRFRGEIDPTASAVRLFLYADAATRPATVEYRNVRISRVTDESLVLWPVFPTAAVAPQVTSQRHGSTYRIHVRGATGPFLVALSESYATGWRLSGLPRGARTEHMEPEHMMPEHMMIDGYRNGWAIDARGDLDLTLSYAPARLGRWARDGSLLTLVALVGLVPFAPGIARRRDRARARWRRARREGPRRIALPESWPDITL